MNRREAIVSSIVAGLGAMCPAWLLPKTPETFSLREVMDGLDVVNLQRGMTTWTQDGVVRMVTCNMNLKFREALDASVWSARVRGEPCSNWDYRPTEYTKIWIRRPNH